MAFANLFASPPGEADFNDLTPACRRSDRPYQNTKRPYETPRNTNPRKRKRKNDVSSDEARKWPNPQKDRQDHRVPFKEEQVDVHQKLSLSQDKETPQSPFWPSSKGHLNEVRRSQKINKKDHYAKHRMHRGNRNEDVNKEWGRETNNGRGGGFSNKTGAKMSKQSQRNTFNQRGGAGSKKGRHKGRMERQRPQREERKPFMTQEFKEQNSIDVNGRLICKHFLGDRCQKGDQCQFEHSHDLGGFKFNDVCKFYVQGFCLKGERCLFMHRTFPCKFFHTGRKCRQDVNCKFSHDALTELTKSLLDKLLEEQKEAREAVQCPTQDPEPKPALDLLNNPIKLSFYSTAPAPENLAAGQFSVGAKDGELIPESPITTNQAAPSSSCTAHTPHTAAAPPPAASPAQSSALKLNLFNSAPPPVCRFSFGANDADFSSHPPSSARQPRLSPARTVPPPDPYTPLTASPPTPSPAQPHRPAGIISSAPPGAEDSFSVKTEGPRSPTPPSATSSVLRTLFTHLSPCRPDDEEEEDGCTDIGPLINVTKLCTKDMAIVEEESHPKVPEPVHDLKAEPGEHVLAVKTEPHFVKKIKEKETEEPVPVPLKPVPCASTPVMNPRRTYRPLSVDLSPLPSLPFTAYRPQLTPTAPLQAVSSKTLNTSANSKSQSAVRCHVPVQPWVGVCKTQMESQGRHSLPVQTLTWSVASTRSVPQPVLEGKRSLKGELDPC